MLSLAEIWPPYGVRITEGDLLLSVVTDDDIPVLVELALAGIHPPEQMPFSTPWTDDDPELPRKKPVVVEPIQAGAFLAS